MTKREEVKCTECGGLFERSVFHPYVEHCPGCRKPKAKTKTKGSSSSKGAKLSREDVACEKCGKEFSRSIAHPYITKCPDCRNTKKAMKKRKSRIGCVQCRGYLHTGEHKPGMYVCPMEDCGTQYWTYGDGWWRTWSTSDNDPSKLHYKENLIVMLDGYISVKEVMHEYPDYPQPK